VANRKAAVPLRFRRKSTVSRRRGYWNPRVTAIGMLRGGVVTFKRNQKLSKCAAGIVLCVFFLCIGSLALNIYFYEQGAYKNNQTIEGVVTYTNYARGHKAPARTEVTYSYYDLSGQLRSEKDSIYNFVKTKDYKGGDKVKLYLARDGKHLLIDSAKDVYHNLFVSLISFLCAVICAWAGSRNLK
jgi:hypothetical protein